DRAWRIAQSRSADRGRVRVGRSDWDTGHPGRRPTLEHLSRVAGALNGLRVLDLSRVLAGPFCCMMLADHGADVIKVEPPNGDETRTWGPPYVDGESTYYLGINRNKRSIALDLTTAAAQDI